MVSNHPHQAQISNPRLHVLPSAKCRAVDKQNLRTQHSKKKFGKKLNFGKPLMYDQNFSDGQTEKVIN